MIQLFIMKTTIVIILALLGLYWLAYHFGPYSHAYFGLYNHMAHRVIGVVLLVVAALIAWKWKRRTI
jgi:membrane protein DedA with SNARE-associated domain